MGCNSQKNLILLHVGIKNEILVGNYSERKRKNSKKTLKQQSKYIFTALNDVQKNPTCSAQI